MSDFRCSICGDKIPNVRAKNIYREVVGWVKDRKAGGIHHLLGHQPTGRYAHNACAEGEKYISTQMSLDELMGEE